MIENLLTGFALSLSASNLLYCFMGVTIGTVVGLLPGLGPVSSIALLLPLTYKMEVLPAVIMLAGIYYGVQYGGTITSVLVNIPGEASTVVTCLDGHQMAKKGRAGAALGIAAFGSFIAGTFGILMISLMAPLLAKVALAMGPPEYVALMLAGLCLVTFLSGKSMLKSLMMAALGLLLGTVGIDSVSGQTRFTFGATPLLDGIDLALMAMGIFGLGEVLAMLEGGEGKKESLRLKSRIRDLLPDRNDWKASSMPIARGSVLGFFLGLIPGGGAVLASFISYAVEKRYSKRKEEFGSGVIEGVAGPESANNSAAIGAFVPLLSLGIPANPVMALLFAALMIHGLDPGPLLLLDNPGFFWGVLTSMYIGNVLLLILNVPLIGLLVKILRVPDYIMAPIITIVCLTGAYSLNNDPSSILIVSIFGLIGYLMRKYEYDPAPLVLAFVLGPVMENSLRQSLKMFQGDVFQMISRPVVMVILLAILLLFVSPVITKRLTKAWHRRYSYSN